MPLDSSQFTTRLSSHLIGNGNIVIECGECRIEISPVVAANFGQYLLDISRISVSKPSSDPLHNLSYNDTVSETHALL